MRLRNRVREARVERGLNLSQLADAAGLSRPTVRAIERDDGYEPTASVMSKLCETLGTPDLFWFEEEAVPAEAVA